MSTPDLPSESPPSAFEDGRLTLVALSHDLRAPLTTTTGASPLLTQQLQRGSRRPALELPDLIEQAATHVANALDALCEVALAGTDALVGMWDEGRLLRVLANLVGNALKYSAARTPVAVHVGREPGGRERLEVVDGGIGIPAADLPHLFEPFHRGANAAGRVSGSGIGLASERAIVEGNGGTVIVASTEGRWKRVTVCLLCGGAPRLSECSVPNGATAASRTFGRSQLVVRGTRGAR